MANNDQNNNKNGKGRNNLRGILTLVAWALVLTVGFNYLNAYNRNATNKSTSHEIKYSEMLDLIENDKAEEVLFKDDAIYITPVEGYTYTEKQDENSTVPAKSYTQSKDTKLTLYTAYLNDTSLLPLLKEHKVAYTGYYEAQMNPVLAFMVSYILPTLIMVGLLMLLLRMLAKSGGSGFGSLLLGDRLRTLLLHLGLGSQTCLLGSLGVGGELRLLRSDLAQLLLHPLVELGLGIRLRESALGYTAQQVLLVEYALVRKNRTAGVRGLRAFHQPIQSPFEIELDRSRIRNRVVGTQFLDEFAITWRSAICGNDMIERRSFLSVTCQTNFNSHLLVKI